MAAKKMRPDWEIALEYYLFGNILSLLPAAIIYMAIDRTITNVWIYVLLKPIATVSVLYFSFLVSARYVSKHYLIAETRKIANLSALYLIGFNSVFLLFLLQKNGYLTAAWIASSLSVVGGAIILFVHTPMFMPASSADEIAAAKAAGSPAKGGASSGLRGIFRTAFLTAAGVVSLIFAPFILYFVVISQNAPSWLGWAAVVIWEIACAYALWRLAFRKRAA